MIMAENIWYIFSAMVPVSGRSGKSMCCKPNNGKRMRVARTALRNAIGSCWHEVALSLVTRTRTTYTNEHNEASKETVTGTLKIHTEGSSSIQQLQ